jgi:hypothetical protein
MGGIDMDDRIFRKILKEYNIRLEEIRNFDQCIALGVPSLEALTGALKSPNRSLRLNAVRALSRIKKSSRRRSIICRSYGF